MNNEYILEPLDPLEISFSKDKCNISGTPRPSKQKQVLPTTGVNSRDKSIATIDREREKIYVRPFESSLKASLLPWDLTLPIGRSCRWTDKPIRKQQLSSPKRRLTATTYQKKSGSAVRKYQPTCSNPSAVRRVLDFTLRNHHETEMSHIDDMLKRISLQLESSARCLERFTTHSRR